MASGPVKRWLRFALLAVGWVIFAMAAWSVIVESISLVSKGTSVDGDSPGATIGLIIFSAIVAAGLFYLLRRPRRKRKVEAVQQAQVEQRTMSWTERDEALLHTLRTVGNYHRNRGDLVAGSPTVLAPRYDDEIILGQGRYDMVWWGKVGDGSWSTNGIVVAGTGAVGLGLVAGSLIGNSVAKSRAKARAAADATVTWRPVDTGLLHVSNYGFFLTHGEFGYRAFEWGHIASAQMVDEGTVEFSAQTDQGFQTWRIISDWSEAIFGLWALVRNQQHPQWVDGSWYPGDVMRARLEYFGKSPDDAAQSLPVRISS